MTHPPNGCFFSFPKADERGNTFIWDIRDASGPIKRLGGERSNAKSQRTAPPARSLRWIVPSRIIHVDAFTGDITRMYPYARRTPGTVIRKASKENVKKEWIPRLGTMYNEVVVTSNGNDGGRKFGLVPLDDAALASVETPLMSDSSDAYNPWILLGHSCGALFQMNSTMKYHYDDEDRVWKLHFGNKRSQITKHSIETMSGLSPFLLRCARSSASPSSSTKSLLVLDETAPIDAPSYTLANDDENVPIDAVAVHPFGPGNAPTLISAAVRSGIVVLMIKR